MFSFWEKKVFEREIDRHKPGSFGKIRCLKLTVADPQKAKMCQHILDQLRNDPQQILHFMRTSHLQISSLSE